MSGIIWQSIALQTVQSSQGSQACQAISTHHHLQGTRCAPFSDLLRRGPIRWVSDATNPQVPITIYAVKLMLTPIHQLPAIHQHHVQ